MATEFEAPESVDAGGGNFLKEPGSYHFAVVEADEAPMSKNNQLLNGFRITAEVLAGTVAGQEKKTVDLMFFNPDLSGSPKGIEMSRKKQWRFGMAVGLLGGPKQAGEKTAVELAECTGRQFKATVAFDEQKEEKKFLQLHYADVWHVDDPDAAFVPVNERALALIPPAFRRKRESFTKAPAATNGNGGASNGGAAKSQPAKRETVGAGAGAGAGQNKPLADLDDL